MPQVIYTEKAIMDVKRLYRFLAEESKPSAENAVEKIYTAIDDLELFPFIGREVDTMPEGFRELIIKFGRSGYVVLYRYWQGDVVIVALRHQKEAGFKLE